MTPATTAPATSLPRGHTGRTCSVPIGRELFFPVLNAVCGEDDGCAGWFDDAERSATLDGVGVEVREINTGVVEIEAVEGNSVTGAAGPLSVIVVGWWVRLPPLAAGPHRIEIYGRSVDGFEVSVTYELVAGDGATS